MNYGLKQSTAPTAEPVKAHDVITAGLIPNSVESAQLENWCVAARQLCETFTRRQFITATWQMTLDYFPEWAIYLPRPPWISITSVTYVDTAGASQTLSSSNYTLDTVRGRLTPSYGNTWPSTRDQANAVTITYTSGYGTAANDVPHGIRQAIVACVLDWAENRRMVYMLPSGVQNLLMSFWTGDVLENVADDPRRSVA